MMVLPRHGVFPRRNRHRRPALQGHVIHPPAVTSPIDWCELAFDLLQQSLEDLAIRPRRRRDRDPDDIFGLRINGHMDLAPGSPLAHAMLAHFPFPFTVKLQPGRIYHHMHWPWPLTVGNPDRQGLAT